MVLDMRSASLARAAADRDATKEKIAALDRLPTTEAMADMTEAQRYPIYEAWASGRRVLLNQQLARQQAKWCNELAAARQAFGRDHLLRKL